MPQELPRLKGLRFWLPLLLAAVAVVSVVAAIRYGASTRSVLLFVVLFVAISAVETGLYEFIRKRFRDNVALQGLLFLVFTVLLLGLAYSFW